MSTALAKGGMAMMGAGGVGLGGWALSSHLKQEEDAIKTILKSKGHKLTSELPEDKRQEAWTKVAKTYVLEVNEDLRIGTGNVSADNIRDWCVQNIESKGKGSLLKKAEKWCVVYSTFTDKLKTDNLELETDANTLNGKYSSLGDLQEEVNKIQISNGGSNSNGEKLKKWCETKSDASHSESTNSLYEKFKQHCSKANATSKGS
ncbi:hypothetical protein HF1_05480 [Mycoplasma haemofelis str. Langford 1]|uniref:Uncharacterized protein n=1 Tax=Mycoplasma haemofelis (strain Langford 1) TaxID=941640 RepID=E8ZHD5_MYCHL|nr:hypothetical protein [Mycoplasma haemofelis]CBY92556.1 hypothetical protein HF1_05480 [Mycoplasma haemofelis str. Langford 1]